MWFGLVGLFFFFVFYVVSTFIRESFYSFKTLQFSDMFFKGRIAVNVQNQQQQQLQIVSDTESR